MKAKVHLMKTAKTARTKTQATHQQMRNHTKKAKTNLRLQRASLKMRNLKRKMSKVNTANQNQSQSTTRPTGQN